MCNKPENSEKKQVSLKVCSLVYLSKRKREVDKMAATS